MQKATLFAGALQMTEVRGGEAGEFFRILARGR
jgi:hypothetical protein